MADNALRRLLRLTAGVALSQGPLGHQLLGQLLILGGTDLEIAGANLVFAATARQRSTIGQVALRTAVPALAVHALFGRTEARIAARERRLQAQEAALRAREKDVAFAPAQAAARQAQEAAAAAREQALRAEEATLATRRIEVEERERALGRAADERDRDCGRLAELQQEIERLRKALAEAPPRGKKRSRR
jgi:hypothetical protein